MATSAYHVYQGRWKITSLDTIDFFDTHVCINNPHWQSSRIIIFLCKYYIVISDTLVVSLLDVVFLLLAVVLSELHEKPRRNKDELQKKVHRRTCVKDITFLTARLPFYVIFCCFLRLLPSQVTSLLNGSVHNITIGSILCDDIMRERSKIWKSLAN